jgi:hypothetical protein
LLDHLRRREYARENFPAKVPPYFDDRGKYYIKYGRPVIRFEDSGGLKRVSFFSSETYRTVQGQYPYKGGPEKHYMVTANESWAYPNIARDFVVHFMKDGPAYREIENLTEVLASHQRKNLPWQWSDLVKQRAAISPLFGRTAQEIEQFESAIISSAVASRRSSLLRVEIQSSNERLMEISRVYEHEAGQARINLPPAAHEPVKAINRLAFQETIAQFRGANGHTRVEITFLAPLEKLRRSARRARPIPFPLSLPGCCATKILIPWRPNTGKMRFRQNGRRWKIFQMRSRLSFLAPPQQVEVALQVQSQRLDKLGYAKQALTIRDFSSRELMLSDLQFYIEVKTENQSLLLPTVEKQNLLLAPYPYLKVQKRLPLFCYFEIYNLRAAGISENYEITYKVISNLGQESLFKKLSRVLAGGKETAISLSQAQPVVDEASQELIALDLAALSNGPHRLEITVADAKNTKMKASLNREIVIED